ncbi:MAG: cardiolipin synthase [Tyzzerella sp.]|nr:cardiolipin synthase [Tyzzerella sp.]
MKVSQMPPVKKAKKGIFHIVFSRAFVVVLLLLIQIIVLASTVTYLKDYATAIYASFLILEVVSIIYVINSSSNPAFKITWILVILMLPIFGTAFYVFVKLQPGIKFLEYRLKDMAKKTMPYMQQDEEILEALRLSKPANANLATYLNNQVSFPVHRNTAVKYFASGEEKFEEMKKQLRKAEKFIFLEYFIVEKGTMWNEILSILKDKVWEGVEVRFMYDGMCSMIQMPYGYEKEMRRAGIKCKLFSPIRPVLSSYQNNRDHRKICVVDGKVAFTGGINLADEYINVKERFGHWKDTAVMLEGEAVQSFTMMFLQMWNVNERRQESFAKYLTPKSAEVKRELGFVLPYADSPFDNENIGKQVYLHILNHAKKYVHIMTPYLIVDNEMMDALTYVAKCGIEVIIIMPHIPDKKYAFVVAKTYYQKLMEAGVKIYEYTPGFVHAKVFVSDNDTATVGTVNLDYRSLYHHFECGAFIYNNTIVWDVEKDFQNTLAECQLITMEDLKSISLAERLVGSVLRLIAPLM